MAPKVQVPMDFGVKYLGSPSHGNLKFRLKGKEEIPANSMIISYNSPVIESLTTDFLQTSIDVNDFCKDAVQCFLESCYSGKLQKITRTNFRDANKMSNVFEVSWLVKRCFEYFEKLVIELDTDSYEDQHFLFEEAMFIWVTLKNRKFVEVVIKKFSSEIVKCNIFFVTRYLTDLPSHKTSELDVIIDMVGKQKQVLMEVLIHDIERNSETISANGRYLLEKVTFADCCKSHMKSHDKLFDLLSSIKSPSKEDYGLIVRLLRNSDKTMTNSLNRLQPNQRSQAYITIPNCKFLQFRHIQDYSNLVQLDEFLKSVSFVNNSYIFFDAIYCWVFEKSENGPVTIDENPDFAEKFIELILQRGWKPLVAEYVKGKDDSCVKILIEKLNKVTAFKSYENYSRILSVDDYSPEEFFGRDNDVKFYFKHPTSEKCQDREKCGFILRVTGMVGKINDVFNIQVVLDSKSYPSDIHFFNECINAENMHVALAIDGDMMDYPISWSGKPCLDVTNKYYMWGQHRFYNRGEGSDPDEDDHLNVWRHGSDARLRLVVYHFG
jgi:hypothetical protein